jgi:hypothetical protein
LKIPESTGWPAAPSAKAGEMKKLIFSPETTINYQFSLVAKGGTSSPLLA